MVSYAMICGIAPLTAVTVYSLAGFSGLGGRLLLGVLADRFGAKHILVGGLFVQVLHSLPVRGGHGNGHESLTYMALPICLRYSVGEYV